MQTEHCSDILKEHGIAPEEAVVCGSTPIALSCENFRTPNDLDVVVSFWGLMKLVLFQGWHIVFPKRHASWKELHAECPGCEAFFCWKTGTTFVPYKTLVRESSLVGKLHVANMAFVKHYKRFLKREKDIRDLAFLRRNMPERRKKYRSPLL